MGISERLKRLLRKTSPETKEITEEQYYTDLFIKSNDWNKPSPNFEEKLRWDIIKNYVFYISGYFYGEKKKEEITILDLGCGRGWLTNLLSEYGNVIGIEPVREVVDYGRTLFPKLELLYGTTKDLIDLGRSGQFDVIVCSEVIEHISDEKKVGFLKEISLLLKNNGFLIITTPRKDAQAEWLKYVNPDQPIEDWLSEDEVLSLLQENDFSKHLLSRFSISPNLSAPLVEIYQLWLAQKI